MAAAADVSRREAAVSAAVDDLRVSAYTIPTASPEADGTLAWDSTTLVVVEPYAAGIRGIGYSWADTSTAEFIHRNLREVVTGLDALNTAEAWIAMVRRIRNLGRPGVSSMAIAAVDIALWDLKARLLGVSVAALLGPARDSIPVYGSGGFTSYSIPELQRQLKGWVDDGIGAVKMKIGSEPRWDVERVAAARDAIGDEAALFVDANGAYSRKQALAGARAFADLDVTWFEEPVSSDDLEGLRLIRDGGPAGMDIAAGEYGYDAAYFRRMAAAGAVDVVQADATRCAGITGFLQANAICEAWGLPLSAHTAPTVHAHVCCAATRASNVEYFFDHYRIEQTLFDGALKALNGRLRPDHSRPGLGIELKRPEAERFLAYDKTGKN